VIKVTGSNGEYTIPDINPGQYTVRATKDGYQDNGIAVQVQVGQTSTADIQLTLLVPTLSVTPDFLDFGIANTVSALVVQNSTLVGSLTWAAVADCAWVSLDPTSGTVTTNTQPIAITVNRGARSPGNYNARINVTSNGGVKTVPIAMVVQNPNAPQLSVSTQYLDFDSVTSSREITISNTGTGSLSWSLADDQPWILASPTSGNISTGGNAQVLVSVDRSSLPIQSYNGNINVASNGGSSLVAIAMRVADTGMLPAPILTNPTNITNTSMALAWTRIVNNRFGYYRLFKATHPGVGESSEIAFETADAGQNSTTASGLLPGTRYYFKVFAYNDASQGSPSNEVTGITTVPLGNWSTLGEVESITTGDISAVSDNEVYIVGQDYFSGGYHCKVARWNGTAWSLESTPLSGGFTTSTSVSFRGSNNGAVCIEHDGSNAELLKWDGVSWTIHALTWQTVSSISTLSLSNIWIGGDRHVYHWNGSTWANVTLASANFMSLSFSADSVGWAANSDGTVYYYNGTGWSSMGDLGPEGTYSISSASDGSVCILRDVQGNQSIDSLWIRQVGEWLGLPELASDWDGNDRLNSVSCQGSDDIWCNAYRHSRNGSEPGGYYFYHWNGDAWSRTTSPVEQQTTRMVMTSPTTGWAIAGSQVLRYSL